MTTSGFAATERLARRVLDGEVVFFVGSGFSIDSEGNDAARLVGRLLAAVLAMGTVLSTDPAAPDSQAGVLLDRLGVIFGLAGAQSPGAAAREPARCMTTANLKLLAREYYNFNDWTTSALSVLSKELLDLDGPRRADRAAAIQKLATFLLGLVNDPIPLDEINCAALEQFEHDAARGKALFLDVMGFANPSIMAGTPLDASIEQVGLSYRGRLRPRHHALARLAREGLAPAMVTTNYDLLLEGAYRLAGFIARERAEANDGTPSDKLPRFSTIAGADNFFAQGQGYRTALLLKIHGCAQAYRTARTLRLDALKAAAEPGGAPAPAVDPWAAYLPALVFTYREIQTWRADAWSRDLIRTLLRTHTIVLCGYSGADPIMHATFREVYDEKAQSRVAAGLAAPAATDSGNASAFFFGIARRREFHSLEILRAATAAAGLTSVKLTEHPNHIEFERSGSFPTIDDHFRWLMHTVVRRRQAEALDTRLRRLVPRLLQQPWPPRDKEIVRLRERFDALCTDEQHLVAAAHPAAAGTPATDVDAADTARDIAARIQAFDRTVSWTWHFAAALLREYAIADTVETYQGAGRAIRVARRPTYYHPIAEHPEWAAWAVVVELALRSLVAALQGQTTLMPGGLAGEESAYAAISFTTGNQWEPHALCIRMGGFERHGRAPALNGAFRRVTEWQLREQDVPWPLQERGGCPAPASMWNWAIGRTVPTRSDAQRILGVAV